MGTAVYCLIIFIVSQQAKGETSTENNSSWSMEAPAAAASCRLGPSALPYDQQLFNLITNCICYVYVANQGAAQLLNTPMLRPNYTTGLLVDENGNQHEPDPRDKTGAPYLSFRYPRTAELWLQCCQTAEKCCQGMIKEDVGTLGTSTDKPSSQCPSHWDPVGCWPAIGKGKFYESNCPDYSFAYRPRSPCKRLAQRKCNETAFWKTINEMECLSLEFHRYRVEQPPNDVSSSTVASPEDDTTSEISGQTVRCCRHEGGYELSEKAFWLDTCARCFKYLPPVFKGNKLRYEPMLGALFNNVTNEIVWTDPANATCQVVSNEINNNLVFKKWLNCCKMATECCVKMSSTKIDLTHSHYCPRTWDGWQCVSDTPPGTTAQVLCPDHAYNFHKGATTCPRYAERKCMSDGQWFKRDGKIEYTDYVTCAKTVGQKTQEIFYVGCLVISLVSLIPALFIFFSYRQLRVARIKMHQNFFLSLILNCIFNLLFRALIIIPELDEGSEAKDSLTLKNNAGCKILLVLVRYFRMCTYTWMLCEGFYLQRLITAAFAEQKSLLIFYIIGWVFPTIPLSAYAITKKVVDDNLCWTEAHHYEWIFGALNVLCIFLNVVFLFNIIRVLITKLRSIQSNEPSHYRKAVRATLVLIPLFGVHFTLAMYNGGSSSCQSIIAYKYFKDGIDGLQGFGVAVIFCYMNGEVLYLLKRSYERYKVGHGLQSLRARLSMSTQVTTQDIHTTHHKATPPMANGSTKRPRDDKSVTAASTPVATTTSSNNVSPVPAETPVMALSPQSKDQTEKDGFYNISLNDEKVTEL